MTDKINNESLWGNAVEIVKCLRDAYGPNQDAEYKDICLSIILQHFVVLDKHLNLLPADKCKNMKELLHELPRMYKEEDEENQSEKSSDEESDD